MNIVNVKYGIELSICENEIAVLTIENREVFANLTESLWRQSMGDVGDWILSSNNKELKIDKSVAVVFNPFEINPNEKRVITKLHQELRDILLSFSFEECEKLNGHIVQLLDELSENTQYDIGFDLNLDVGGLLKLYKVEIQTDAESLVERIIEYIKVLNRICGIRNLVFMNLKSFLKAEDLRELYKSCFYEKVNLLIIESFQTEKNPGEKHLILDNDLCLIQDY